MLARDRAVSLLEILQALDGVPELNVCLQASGCHRSPWCGAHEVWGLAQARMRETLAAATLDQLVAETRARQAAQSAGRA